MAAHACSSVGNNFESAMQMADMCGSDNDSEHDVENTATARKTNVSTLSEDYSYSNIVDRLSLY